MKTEAIKGSSTNRVSERQSHSPATFAKVVDGRKQPIRGLWIRGERYYAQLTVEDPNTGAKEVRRVPLKDKDGIEPVKTQAEAVAALERLKVKRVDNDLPSMRQTPKFTDYVKTYLETIKAGEGAS